MKIKLHVQDVFIVLYFYIGFFYLFVLFSEFIAFLFFFFFKIILNGFKVQLPSGKTIFSRISCNLSSHLATLIFFFFLIFSWKLLSMNFQLSNYTSGSCFIYIWFFFFQFSLHQDKQFNLFLKIQRYLNFHLFYELKVNEIKIFGFYFRHL